jgi:hypothetical protein
MKKGTNSLIALIQKKLETRDDQSAGMVGPGDFCQNPSTDRKKAKEISPWTDNRANGSLFPIGVGIVMVAASSSGTFA